MPRTSQDAELAARIAELEERLAELEARDRGEDPFERLMTGVLPPATRGHLRAARKEQLLAARAFIDHWIERIDQAPKQPRRRRESIPLE